MLVHEVAAEVGAEGAVGGGGGGVEAEGIEDAEVYVGGLPDGDIGAGRDAGHVEETPVRWGYVEGVGSLQMNCVDDLSRMLKVGGDDDAGLLFQTPVLGQIGLGERIFEDHVETVEAPGQIQRVVQIVKALVGVEDYPQVRRDL